MLGTHLKTEPGTHGTHIQAPDQGPRRIRSFWPSNVLCGGSLRLGPRTLGLACLANCAGRVHPERGAEVMAGKLPLLMAGSL